MGKIVLQVDPSHGAALISHTKLCPDPIRFAIPDFQGKGEEGSFAIRQNLLWEEADDGKRLKFRLQGDPADLGIEFRGHLSVETDEVQIRAELRNVTSQTIQSGHHCVLIDASGCAAMQDTTGERTIVYAETGWASLAKLLDPIHSRNHTVRMGAAYNGVTVMWKIMGRVDPQNKCIAALALDKAFAFAGEHPQWPKGILGSYRWGAIAPQHTQSMKGRFYLMKADLNKLRLRYANDFK